MPRSIPHTTSQVVTPPAATQAQQAQNAPQDVQQAPAVVSSAYPYTEQLTVAMRASQQAIELAKQMADTRAHRAALQRQRAEMTAAYDTAQADAQAKRQRMRQVVNEQASASVSGQLLAGTAAAAEANVRLDALTSEHGALASEIAAWEAGQQQRDEAYMQHDAEIAAQIAAAEDALAAMERTHAAVVATGEEAHANAGQAKAAALARQISERHARLKALESDVLDARLDLRLAQEAIAADLADWPDLAEALEARYGLPVATEDARTRTLDAWRAFLLTLDNFARADHTPVRADGQELALYDAFAIREHFWPLLLGYRTSIQGVADPDQQRDMLISERQQRTERLLAAIRDELTTHYRQQQYRNQRRQRSA